MKALKALSLLALISACPNLFASEECATTEIRGLSLDHCTFSGAMEEKFAGVIEEVYDVSVLYTNLYIGDPDEFSVFFSIRLIDGGTHEDFSCTGTIYLGETVGYEPPFLASIDDCENPEGVALDDGNLIWSHEELGLFKAGQRDRIIISPLSGGSSGVGASELPWN